MQTTEKCLKCDTTLATSQEIMNQEDRIKLCAACLGVWCEELKDVDPSEAQVNAILNACFHKDILVWCKTYGRQPSLQSLDFRERALAEMLRRFTEKQYCNSGLYAEDIKKYAIVDILTEKRLEEYYSSKLKIQK